LGDQPQVLEETVRDICTAFNQTKALLVIPSYQNRRGHPWLAARPLWSSILAQPSSSTPRDFLNTYAGQVEYISADRSILKDLDTPADYTSLRP
jgi:molybdenum cofactor cytidylyltransferase